MSNDVDEWCTALNQSDKEAILDSAVDHSDINRSVVKDLKNLKAGIKFTRDRMKWVKPIVKYELKLLPHTISNDELKTLQNLAKQSRISGKKGRAITNAIQNDALRANTKKALKISINKFKDRILLDKVAANLNIVDKVLKSYNSALTACINLADPNGIRGMPALVFEMLARSGEICFVDGLSGLVVTTIGIAEFPVVVTVLAPVAVSILIIKPSWDLIESTARSLVKQLQSHADGIKVHTNLNDLSHTEIANMLPNPIALIYDRNMEDLAQRWLPVINPVPVTELHVQLTDNVAQNLVNNPTLPDATEPNPTSNQKSNEIPEFKRHTTVDAGIKADIFGQPGLGFESQTQMSEQSRLRVAANLAGLIPETRAISASGDIIYQGDNSSVQGSVSVYKATAGAGVIVAGSIVTADGAVAVGFSSTYGWFVSLSAMTPWGAVAVTAAIVAVGAGLLTKKLLDNRAENFFPCLDNKLKPNRTIAKFVALSCKSTLTKNEQKKLRAAFEQSKVSADAVGLEFLAILEYFQTHRSVDAITALQTHDYQKLLTLHNQALQASTVPIYADIEAGNFQGAYDKCSQSQQDFPGNQSLNALQTSILDIIKLQEMVKPIYADIEAGDFQEAYQKCTQVQQIFPDNVSLNKLKQSVSTQVAYYKALDILGKQGCDVAMQYFVNHAESQQDIVRYQFALSVAFVHHGNLSDASIEYCKEAIQRFLAIPDIADSEKGTAHFCQAYFLSLRKDYAARESMLAELETAHALNKTSSSIATLLAKEYARRVQYEQARMCLQDAGEASTIVDLAVIEHRQLSLMIFSNMMDYVIPFLKFMQPGRVRGLLKTEQIVNMASSGAFLLWRYQAEFHIDAQQQRELAYFFSHCSAEERAICEALLPFDKNLQQLRNLQLSISVLIFVRQIVSHLAPKGTWKDGSWQPGAWDKALQNSGVCLDVANTTALSTLSWAAMQRAFKKRSQALSTYRASIERSDTIVAISSSMDSMLSLLDAIASAFFVLVPVCSYIDRNYYEPRRNSGHAPMNVTELVLDNIIWTTATVGGVGLSASLLYHYRDGIDDMLRYVVNNCLTDPATLQNMHAGIDLARQQLEAWSKEGIELTKDALQKIIENLDKIPVPTPEQVAIALGAAIVIAGGTYVYFRQKWYYNGINNTKTQLQHIRQDPENADEYIREADRYNTLILTHFDSDETALRQKAEIAINKILIKSGFAEPKKPSNKKEGDTSYELSVERRQYADEAIALCDQAILEKPDANELRILRYEALLHAVKLVSAINNVRKTHANQQTVTSLLNKARADVEAISEKTYWSNRGLYWLYGDGQDYWKKTLELEMLEARYVAVLNAIKKLETYNTSSTAWLDQLRDLRNQTHQAMQLFSKNVAIENKKSLTTVSSQLLTRHFEPRFEAFNASFTQQQRIWRGGKAYCVQPDGICTEWVEQNDQQQKVDDIVVKSSRLYKITHIQDNHEEKEEVKEILFGQVVWVKNNIVYHLERWISLTGKEKKVGDLVEETQYQKITSITEEDGKLVLIKNAFDEQTQVSIKIQQACYEPTVTSWFDGVIGQFLDDTVLFPGEKQEWMRELERKMGIWVADTQSTLVIVKNNEKNIRSALDHYKISWRDFIARTGQEIEHFLEQLAQDQKLYKTKKEAPVTNSSVEELKVILTQQVATEDTAVSEQLAVCADADQTLLKEISEADKRTEALQHILNQGQQRLDRKLELLVSRSMQVLVFKTSVELSTSLAQIMMGALSRSYTRFLSRQHTHQSLPNWTYNLNAGTQHKPTPSRHPFWHKSEHVSTTPIQTNTVKHVVPTVVNTLFSAPRKKPTTPFSIKKTTPRSLF